MTSRKELERSITLNQRAVVFLEAKGRNADRPREAIRAARREIWEIEQPPQDCVNW